MSRIEFIGGDAGKAVSRPRARVRALPDALFVLGGIAVAASQWLTWTTVSAGRGSAFSFDGWGHASFSPNGSEVVFFGGSGGRSTDIVPASVEFGLGLAAVVLVSGLAVWRRNAGPGSPVPARLRLLLAGMLAGVAAERALDVSGVGNDALRPGVGYWLALGGAAVVLLAALQSSTGGQRGTAIASET